MCKGSPSCYVRVLCSHSVHLYALCCYGIGSLLNFILLLYSTTTIAITVQVIPPTPQKKTLKGRKIHSPLICDLPENSIQAGDAASLQVVWFWYRMVAWVVTGRERRVVTSGGRENLFLKLKNRWKFVREDKALNLHFSNSSFLCICRSLVFWSGD